MAEAVIVGAVVGGVVGDAVSKSSTLIIKVINKTRHFKSQLKEMGTTIKSMKPTAEKIDELNKELDGPIEETEKFNNLLKDADVLILKCEKIKVNPWKRYWHASKLDKMNRSLRDYVQVDLQLQTALKVAETLVVARRVEKRLEKERLSASGAPLQKGVVIGFDDRVSDLKAMMPKKSPDDDCSIVVVTGPGGSGKTTFVNLFCNDPEIQERFGPRGTNIYYVTVSQNYDPKVVVTKLLGELPGNTSNEDAIKQWGSFLKGKESEILLVLDDVWSESVITDFKFMSPGYKILVTSRFAFSQFNKYQFELLNNQDATRLFHFSAFADDPNEVSKIPNYLVEKLVKCCKNHPLALSVIGGSLKGKHVAKWDLMINQLDEKKMSSLELHESVQLCLQKSLFFFENDPEMKQCYQHLGLFPEDEKIAATTLMDMWTHLYNHDEKGSASFNTLTELSSRNLATLLPIRKHIDVIANYCEEESVMQHDMLRALAIQLCNGWPIEDRETLIINQHGQEHPQLPQTINASVMSITTDKRFPSTWNEIQAPKVEVLVLNFMSNIHPLPQFMQNMKGLKVLIITNYGYYFSDIQNFPAPEYLSGLTRIRLDHVSISSISSTILKLENLQKLSLIMCKIGNGFTKGIPNKLTSLLEIDIDSCDDLVIFPIVLCNAVSLKKLSITNCHELTSLSEEFGELSNLEVLRLGSCTKLTSLPESMRNLKKLRIIDLSHCLSLHELPLHFGELDSLKTIDVRATTSLHDLPNSIKNFNKLTVVCDEETSHLWCDKNMDVTVVEDDTSDTFRKIIPRGHM